MLSCKEVCKPLNTKGPQTIEPSYQGVQAPVRCCCWEKGVPEIDVHVSCSAALPRGSASLNSKRQVYKPREKLLPLHTQVLSREHDLALLPAASNSSAKSPAA